MNKEIDAAIISGKPVREAVRSETIRSLISARNEVALTRLLDDLSHPLVVAGAFGALVEISPQTAYREALQLAWSVDESKIAIISPFVFPALRQVVSEEVSDGALSHFFSTKPVSVSCAGIAVQQIPIKVLSSWFKRRGNQESGVSLSIAIERLATEPNTDSSLHTMVNAQILRGKDRDELGAQQYLLYYEPADAALLHAISQALRQDALDDEFVYALVKNRESILKIILNDPQCEVPVERRRTLLEAIGSSRKKDRE